MKGIPYEHKRKRINYGCAIAVSIVTLLSIWYTQCVNKAMSSLSESIGKIGEDLGEWQTQNTTRLDSIEIKDEIVNDTKALNFTGRTNSCLLYTSPSPRDKRQSRMPSSA